MEGPRRPQPIRGRGHRRPSHLGPLTPTYANPEEEHRHQPFRPMPQRNSRPVNLYQCDPQVQTRPRQQSVGNFQAAVRHPPFCVDAHYASSACRRDEQVSYQPNTTHRAEYEHLYRAFEAKQKKEPFQLPRAPYGSVLAGPYPLAPEQLGQWQEEQSFRQHLSGPYTETTYARQGAPYPGGVYSYLEPSFDAMMRQRNVGELCPGWASSADNQQLWLSTPFTESGARVAQRALPLFSEMACVNYQPPVSQAASIHASPLQLELMPLEVLEELSSFTRLWESLTEAWFGLLQEPTYSLGAWPTLGQVIKKLMMQSVVADYSDEQANFSQESTIWQTPYSVTRSQKREESDRDTQLLDPLMPQSSASFSGWQNGCTPTNLPSRGEQGEFSPPEESLVWRENIPAILRNTGSSRKNPSIEGDLDQTLQGKSTELAPVNLGKLQANEVESRNSVIRTQREAQPCHTPVVECEMPLLDIIFETHSDNPSPAFAQEASMTNPQNRERSEQTGDQAASTKESSKASSLSGDMEHPSSVEEVALHTAAQRSDECLPGYDVALKPKHSSQEKTPPSAYSKKRGSEAPAPANCSLNFERLPSRHHAKTDKVLQEKSTTEETVSPSMTKMGLDEETFANHSETPPTNTSSPTASTSREQTLSDGHMQTHTTQGSTEEGLVSASSATFEWQGCDEESRKRSKFHENARKSNESKKIASCAVPAEPKSPAEMPHSASMKHSGCEWGPRKDVSKNGSLINSNEPLQVNWLRFCSRTGTPSSRSTDERVHSESSSRRGNLTHNPTPVSHCGNGNSNAETAKSSHRPEYSHMDRTCSGPSGRRDSFNQNENKRPLPNHRPTEPRSSSPQSLYSDKCRAPRQRNRMRDNFN